MNRSQTHQGWKPDLPDRRDFIYSPQQPILESLPKKIDMTDKCPDVYTQGHLHSCTGNAIAGAFEFELLKQGLTDFKPSRLFIYYNARAIENTIPTDSGAEIRNGMKGIARLGVCDENQWQYIESEFAQKPYQSCYVEALKHLTTSYHRINQDISKMKACLTEGYPFVFGFTIYNSFEKHILAKTGVVNLPDLKNEIVIGGHAAMAVGYDDSTNRFIIRNSYGPGWGMNGYCTMPYDYLSDPFYSRDFWMIKVIDDNSAQKGTTT